MSTLKLEFETSQFFTSHSSFALIWNTSDLLSWREEPPERLQLNFKPSRLRTISHCFKLLKFTQKCQFLTIHFWTICWVLKMAKMIFARSNHWRFEKSCWWCSSYEASAWVASQSQPNSSWAITICSLTKVKSHPGIPDAAGGPQSKAGATRDEV